jgi:thiol-disulfide isomerase/thioredoxin
MKRILGYAALAAMVLLLGQVAAQDNAGAKAKVDAAKAATKAKKFDEAVQNLREAIDADPGLIEAHESMRTVISQKVMAELAGPESPDRDKAAKAAREESTKQLIAMYEGWLQKYPKQAAIPWMLSELNMYKDYDKVERYAKQAVAVDPKFARAYQTLSLIEEARGDVKKRVDYLRVAAEADPTDPSWSFYYAYSLKDSDPALHQKLAVQVAEKFPSSERGAQSLYWLGFDARKIEDKIMWLERLKASFAPEKYSWSESGMSGLFDAYSKKDPAKALALAQEMTTKITAAADLKSWQTNLAYQKALNEARALLNSEKPAEALAILDKVQQPRYLDASPFHLMKAEAQAKTDKVQDAYDGLLKLMGGTPTDALHQGLLQYGGKLGKQPAAVTADMRALLEKNATPATDFKLPVYGTNKTASLADYRGKVVMVNWWYPFCGPCRGEFPYLQNILTKYEKQGLVILSLNAHPEEDQFVLPYMKGMRFGFIPVKSDDDFASSAYKVRGYPSNFLIDQQGRVIYKPGVIRGVDAQRTLELQIEAVLAQGAGTRASSGGN